MSAVRSRLLADPTIFIARYRSHNTHRLVPLDSLLGHALALEVREKLVSDLVKDALETSALLGLDGSLVGHYGKIRDREVREMTSEMETKK